VPWAPADEPADTAVERSTRAALESAAARLAEAQAPGELVERLRALTAQVGRPCVVAVVGRVNAGKSTFINALLGDDFALVGTTETTATVTSFSYGKPDPERPVRCHWRDGRVTEETPAFLAGLQGSDPEALRRAEGIERLEYLLPNPLLRGVTLVDTPGLGAAVDAHQDRTAEFLDLRDELRRRHDAETRRINDTADAIIYLVGAVALTDDRSVVDQFSEATAGRARAMNALGVLAKVDLDEKVIARREELAKSITEQLDPQLNVVLPVSAGLARACARLEEDPELLDRVAATGRAIPRATLEILLSDDELFCEHELPECPVAVDTRRDLRRAIAIEWRVAATVLALAGDAATPQVLLERLRELGGFDRLRRTLQEHFLERAHILRCFRIVRDAKDVLNGLRFGHLAELRRRSRGDGARLTRFLDLLDSVDGDPGVTAELTGFLRERLDAPADAARVQRAWEELDAELGSLLRELGEHHADFAALQDLQAVAGEFAVDEVDELRALLGLYGSDVDARVRSCHDPEHWVRRQIAWRLVRDTSPLRTRRRAVAERAHTRIGLILEELDRLDDRPSLRGQGGAA
jgi:hypothetical protein